MIERALRRRLAAACAAPPVAHARASPGASLQCVAARRIPWRPLAHDSRALRRRAGRHDDGPPRGAWHATVGKRLVKSPKVYLRDSGVLHALLNIRSVADLQCHPATGASWEGFVVEQIVAAAPSGADIAFYRTAAGAELDVVVALGRRRIGFEIKFSAAPRPTKGFCQAIRDVEVERAYVVAPIESAYPIAKNVDVVPAHRVHEVLAPYHLAPRCPRSGPTPEDPVEPPKRCACAQAPHTAPGSSDRTGCLLEGRQRREQRQDRRRAPAARQESP